MKVYVKPILEFIELKPEERLACGSGDSKCYNQLQNLINLWNRSSRRKSRKNLWWFLEVQKINATVRNSRAQTWYPT